MEIVQYVSAHAAGWVAVIADASVKGAVVLGAAAVGALLARRASAAWRHLLWTFAITAALCLPLLSSLLPASRMRPVSRLLVQTSPSPARPAAALQPAPSVTPTAVSATVVATSAAARTPAVSPRREAAGPQPQPAAAPVRSRFQFTPAWALAVWGLGALLALLPMLVGMVCARRMTLRCSPLSGADWEEVQREAHAALGLGRRVPLRRSQKAAVPMVCGWVRPVILLPADAEAWTSERRRVVLLHELAHVKRADCLLQFLAQVATGLYWFNPLAWLAGRQMRHERERACDDLVLSAGWKPSDYAAHLLALTRGLPRLGWAAIAAVPMARRAGLEARLGDLLDSRRARGRVTRRALIASLLALAALLAPLTRVRAFAAAGSSETELVSADQGPGGRALLLWKAPESFPGDPQYDARLDQPVKVWRAGISLADLFAELGRQSGAKVAFFPAGGQNPRVRVHLFLNPDQPPTLRDLMAQLTWVVDGQFAFAEEDGQKAYYLLTTGLGRDAAVAVRAREEEKRLEGVQRQRDLKGKLQELREALQLPREEALRYQGQDDRMLLNLLDPVRRGVALITADWLLPMIEQAPVGPDGGGYGWGLASSTPEERKAWIAAFGVPASQFSDPKVVAGARVDREGRVTLHCPIKMDASGKVGPAGDYTAAEYPVLDLGPEAALAPEEEVALRRALGETIPAAEEQRYVAQRRAEREAARKERAKEPEVKLSERMRQLLAETRLRLTGRANWQIQEAVAKATGRNVISDGLLYASGLGPGEPTALDALTWFCRQKGEEGLRSPEWEWGDAGSFLRFRTTDREAWRAAMLPPETLAWLEEQVRPHLPEGATQASFRLTLDQTQWTRQFARLSDLQLRYGTRVLHGDPRDLHEVARHALWEKACAYGKYGPALLRFLGKLSDEQWQRLQRGSLTWPAEVTPEQGDLLKQLLVVKSLPGETPAYSRLRLSLGNATSDKSGRMNLEHINLTPPAAAATEAGAPAKATAVSRAVSRSATTGGFEISSGEWYQAVLVALAPGEGGREAEVFKRSAAFLPKALSVQAEAPQ